MIVLRLFVASMFMIIGILLLLKGYEHGSKSYALIKGTESAYGEIVEVVPYLASNVGKTSALKFFPDVKYTPPGGQEITFRSKSVSRADNYKPGDEVRVLYNPEDPTNAVIGSFSHLWAIALIFAVSGALVILFAGWFFQHAFKRKAESRTG